MRFAPKIDMRRTGGVLQPLAFGCNTSTSGNFPYQSSQERQFKRAGVGLLEAHCPHYGQRKECPWRRWAWKSIQANTPLPDVYSIPPKNNADQIKPSAHVLKDMSTGRVFTNRAYISPATRLVPCSSSVLPVLTTRITTRNMSEVIRCSERSQCGENTARSPTNSRWRGDGSLRSNDPGLLDGPKPPLAATQDRVTIATTCDDEKKMKIAVSKRGTDARTHY